MKKSAFDAERCRQSGTRLRPMDEATTLALLALDALDAMVLVHEDGALLHANQAARDELGPVSLLPTWAEGEGTREVSVPRPDGTPRLLEVITTEAAFGVVIIARDITAKRAKQLRADHAAPLATLASGAATEMNNPLSYVLVNVEHSIRQLRALSASGRLDEGLRGAEAHQLVGSLVDSLGQALEGARRARDVLRNLLTFAQGSMEKTARVDVRAVLESALQMSWHAIRPRARIEKQLAEVPVVEASEARLAQVFFVLLVNAAEAIPEGETDKHRVRVVTRTDAEGRVIVEIEDTGCGIRPDVLPHIFDPFFTTGRGAGMGLAVARGIVHGMGGELSVTSSLGAGSSFLVALPSARGAHDLDPVPRVLVVDDDPLVAEAMALALEEGHNVTRAGSVDEAIDRLPEGWDAIVCELTMPETSGMALYHAALRSAPGLVARIVFTNSGALTARTRAFLEGVKRPCVSKPIDAGELRRAIGLVLR